MKKDQFRVLDGILKNSLNNCDSNEHTTCVYYMYRRSTIDLKGYGTDPSKSNAHMYIVELVTPLSIYLLIP